MPMSWSERENHRIAEEKMQASERARLARPVSQPHPWRAQRWGCRGCGIGRPVDGFNPADTIDQVMATSVARDGVVWGREAATGEVFVTCGPNCWRDLEKALACSPAAPAVERIQVTVGPKKPAPPAMTWADTAAPTRPPTFRCAKCGTVPGVHQVLGADGAWTPPLEVLEKQLVVGGWQRDQAGRLNWCSATCATWSTKEVPVQAPGRPALGGDQAGLAAMRGTLAAQATTPAIAPVETLPDASWQRRRADQGSNPLDAPFMTGRDLSEPSRPANAPPPVEPAVAPPVANPATPAIPKASHPKGIGRHNAARGGR